jgi:hypothetical protein
VEKNINKKKTCKSKNKKTATKKIWIKFDRKKTQGG